jgi:hybrid cluster-associated redox disulfide protein
MPQREISGDTLIKDVVDRYPATIKVFMKNCLHCIGCPISHHHTVAECAHENELDVDALVTALNEQAQSQSTQDEAP